MNIEDYVKPGDHLHLMPRSSVGQSVIGTLLNVSGVPGDREFMIVRDSQTLGDHGAFGIPERDVVVGVERGDCWINLGSLLTLDQARVKCERNRVNQVRRNAKDFPLFPDQAGVKELSPEAMVQRVREVAQAELERDHARVAAVNELREEARTLIPPDQFQMLLGRREVYPASPEYGRIFWRKHIEYFREHGHAEPKPTYAPMLSSTLQGDFTLKGPAIWTTAPGGPLPVRILWFGRTVISCKVAGEPIRDYDPILIPKPVVWLKPEEMRPIQ